MLAIKIFNITNPPRTKEKINDSCKQTSKPFLENILCSTKDFGQ